MTFAPPWVDVFMFRVFIGGESEERDGEGELWSRDQVQL